MKYYHVSIAACRRTIIDFFTPKTARSVGVSELLGVSVGRLTVPSVYLVKYVCFHHNKRYLIFAEGAPPIPGTLLECFLK